MKTKKWMAFMLIFALGLTLFSSCTPEMSSYREELQRVDQWPGSDLDGEIKINLRAPEQSDLDMRMQLKGYTQNQGADGALGYLKMTYDPTTVNGEILQPFALDFYFDAGIRNLYLNKSYFTDAYAQNNRPIPKALAEMTEDFIQVDLNDSNATGMPGLYAKGLYYLSSPVFDAHAQELIDTVFAGGDPAFSFAQEGRSYTFEASEGQLMDAIIGHWDILLPQLQDLSSKAGMPLSPEDLTTLEQIRASYDADAIKAAEGNLLAARKDSQIGMTKIFTDTTDRIQWDMTLDLGAEGTMTLTLDATVTRNDDVIVSLPDKVIKMSLDKFIAFAANPAGEVKVVFNGQTISFDQQPVIINDHILVPYRAMGEAMHLLVEWDEEARTVTALIGPGAEYDAVNLTIDSTEAMVNGEWIILDSPAIIMGDRTMVPLRFFSENLGYQVEWNEQMRIVSISLRR